ncbi:hypothetical protein PG997_005398 [Apiospora hydei]|uniref:Uncharacterized protein n=1 Tax=Apiospora hydei TaxID=1337664 RepID=A0ABR1X517_9PEZI
MPFDLDPMDGSIDEIHGPRRPMHPQQQPRYKQMPIDDDLFYNRSPPNKPGAAQTFLAMDDMSEYGARPSGRGRSFSMDSVRPDEHRQFVPAYNTNYDVGKDANFKEVPQFTEANLGFPSPPKQQTATSRRTSRRNSINERKNDANGHRSREEDHESAPRQLPKRPREDEIEAARRILAAAEASSRREPSVRRDSGAAAAATASPQRSQSPPATVRSATPPPIGRPRRYFYDETEPGQQQHKEPAGPGTPDKIPLARRPSAHPP